MQYMQVVIKSISLFEPKLAEKTIHLSHGIVRLAGGKKMSSRKGNILEALDIIIATSEAYLEIHKQTDAKAKNQLLSAQ